jgi:hypothetical protein
MSLRSLPPFVAGSDTSEAAAVSMFGRAPTLREMVLGELRRRAADGATNDELEAFFEWPHQTLSPRVRELVLKGHVVDSGNRRRTRSGRMAIVWRVAP